MIKIYSRVLRVCKLGAQLDNNPEVFQRRKISVLIEKKVHARELSVLHS